MMKVFFVFSLIVITAACVVWDQYSPNERLAMLEKVGLQVPSNNKQTPEINSSERLISPQIKKDKAIYNCLINRQRIITDVPCDELKQSNEVRLQRTQHQEAMDRLERDKELLKQRARDRHARQRSAGTPKYEQRSTVEEQEARCSALQRKKDQIRASQRQGSGNYLNDKNRSIDDEMFELKCGF